MTDYKAIVTEYGSPLYAYSKNVIIKNISLLKNSLDFGRSSFFYAMKANSNISILHIIRQQGFGVDCVSIGEMKTALKCDFSPDRIRFTPSFVNHEEIEFAINKKIQISLDNLSLLGWISNHHPDFKVGIRINPSVMAGAYVKTSVGHAKAKFGIGVEHLDEILKFADDGNVKINGLHIHSGSDILEASQFMQAVEVLLQVAPKFKNLEYIDLGSGFKVPYYPGDKQTDLVDLGHAIKSRFTAFCSVYGKDLNLIFEPGKIVISEAGKFLVTVTGVKTNGGVTFAGVDSGFNHLIRPMFYGAYHHISNISNPEGPVKMYDIVGDICETDTFASSREINEIRVGDILCFDNAGAYCYSMASPYNSRPRPAEILIDENGNDRLIRRRETLDDIWNLQV